MSKIHRAVKGSGADKEIEKMQQDSTGGASFYDSNMSFKEMQEAYGNGRKASDIASDFVQHYNKDEADDEDDDDDVESFDSSAVEYADRATTREKDTATISNEGD